MTTYAGHQFEDVEVYDGIGYVGSDVTTGSSGTGVDILNLAIPFDPDPFDFDSSAEVLADEPDVVRVLATREQMFALSRHGAAVAERGRPTCQYCGNPMDPEGHACPAMNGHSKRD